MIPHSTGASKSVIEVIPSLKDKIWGTSIRVPTINCSLVDCNVVCTDKTATLEKLGEVIKASPFFSTVYGYNDKLLCSQDFMSTVTPSILDSCASMDMAPGQMKLMLWYDNEWSYSAQMIRVMTHMFEMDSLPPVPQA
jgi:glyceraldehyde 3-phosphate dehydrogenase